MKLKRAMLFKSRHRLDIVLGKLVNHFYALDVSLLPAVQRLDNADISHD